MCVSREEALERIEKFLQDFLHGVRSVSKQHECYKVAVGAPRARNPHKSNQVRWEFPPRRPERMMQWGMYIKRISHQNFSSNYSAILLCASSYS